MVGGTELSYEELRRQRMEENKKRMEELRLPQLSQALLNSNNNNNNNNNNYYSSSPKPSHVSSQYNLFLYFSWCNLMMKRSQVELRRSNRIANNPIPDSISNQSVRVEIPRIIIRDDSNEARAYAVTKAEELESSLGSVYPTLVKPMLQSYVNARAFRLGVVFCNKYLPRSDATITLVDEDGQEYPVVYLARKTTLRGGWKEFAFDHELVDGDALVFQLIQPTVLKVYIIRMNTFEETNNL